jgi:hypothetical protein
MGHILDTVNETACSSRPPADTSGFEPKPLIALTNRGAAARSGRRWQLRVISKRTPTADSLPLALKHRPFPSMALRIREMVATSRRSVALSKPVTAVAEPPSNGSPKRNGGTRSASALSFGENSEITAILSGRNVERSPMTPDDRIIAKPKVRRPSLPRDTAHSRASSGAFACGL